MTPSQGIILAGVRRLLKSLVTIRRVSELSELYKERQVYKERQAYKERQEQIY